VTRCCSTPSGSRSGAGAKSNHHHRIKLLRRQIDLHCCEIEPPAFELGVAATGLSSSIFVSTYGLTSLSCNTKTAAVVGSAGSTPTLRRANPEETLRGAEGLGARWLGMWATGRWWRLGLDDRILSPENRIFSQRMGDLRGRGRARGRGGDRSGAGRRGCMGSMDCCPTVGSSGATASILARLYLV
jgi:hypothetical protein